MQPLLIPEVPSLIAYGFLWAFAGIGALWLLMRMESTTQVRTLVVLVIVLLCVGATVQAAQPVTHPCSVIQAGSWLDYLSGCFLSR